MQLDDEMEFLKRPLAMIVTAVTPDGVPAIARGYGCSVTNDRVVVLVAVDHAHALTEAIASGSQVSAVFVELTSYRGIQIKGDDAFVRNATAEELEFSSAYRGTFTQELALLGLDPDKTGGLFWAPPIAIEYVPSHLFDQTPGPNAGEAIGAGR